LAIRLHGHGNAMDVLVTANSETLPLLKLVPDGVQVVSIPTDTHVKVREFFAEWEPQYLIWIGGPVRRVLLHYVKKTGFNATMINARISTLFAGKSRWLPGASRNAVLPFTHVLTADGATATRLIRGGVPREKVVAIGPVLEEPITLPHDANELTVVIEALRTRPLWFATSVTTPEIIHIVAAHLAASRKNHRLLLIINPRDIYSGPYVAQALREAGFKVGVRSEGDDPEPEHQAYVADLADELGLWYRIAPLTFIGGTLAAGGAISPFESIALGSAVIHGPRKSPHATQFARLEQADASRQIRSAAELGIAVGMLISPEQTARMALAGWSEITQNAETINWLVLNAVQSTEVTR
jgi:3-deoxy-D-manno-octulosonic-acid transferase